MKEIGIGLLGFGTVGAGVVDTLRRHGELVAERTGLRLALRGIADLDLESDRGVAVDRALLTRDAEALVRDPRCEVIVELVGGTGAARALVLQALALGKPVVTANKALLARHGAEILRAARAHRTGVFFEGSVAGAVPIIRAVQEGLLANQFQSIYGILNGTCNFILSRMEEEGRTFEEVLAEAQREGFAEKDPTLDVDGWDTAHKAAILAALAFGRAIPFERIPVQGIRGIAPADLAYARELGYRLKLLAVLRRHGELVEVGVRPSFVSLGHVLASVGGVFNAVLVAGDVAGETLYYGRGAGRYPTASAVVGDIADAASRLTTAGPWNTACFAADDDGRVRLRDPGAVRARHYLRFALRDRPGVFARVATALGRHEISIASLIQKESHDGGLAPVVVTTHAAGGRNVRAALAEIDALDGTGGPTVHFPIEDFAEAKG